jgi:dTDP-4-dehydrorhamnose reductase
MKILITGAKGMLGQMLAEVLDKHDLVLTDRQEMDITDSAKVLEVFKKEKPEVVVHTAAYVDVEKAESDRELAKKINITGSKNIAKAAKKAGATVINISTDYVFDGQKNNPYLETDPTNPLSVYANSKLKGECEIIKGCKESYSLRVSWLYGEHTKRNFVQKMIDLAKKNGQLKVVFDQIGSPTYTRDVAKIVLKIIDRIKKNQPIKYGVYHLSGKGETSRFEFAKQIMKLGKIKAQLIPVKSSEFLTIARRPDYSYLDKSKIEKTLGIKIRSWQAMLKDYFVHKN